LKIKEFYKKKKKFWMKKKVSKCWKIIFFFFNILVIKLFQVKISLFFHQHQVECKKQRFPCKKIEKKKKKKRKDFHERKLKKKKKKQLSIRLFIFCYIILSSHSFKELFLFKPLHWTNKLYKPLNIISLFRPLLLVIIRIDKPLLLYILLF